MTKKAGASRSSNSTRSTLIKIDAKPGPIAIDTAKTAVIVVDMENDFGSKGGMFDLAGIDISMIQTAVGSTERSSRPRAMRTSRSSISRWVFIPTFPTWVPPTL